MGSRTFQSMAAFWPTSSDAFASAMNEIPKAVFSKRGSAILNAAAKINGPKDAQANAENNQSAPLQTGAESWAEAYVAGGDLSDEITRLKTGDGKPIIAHGGAALARSLIALELVDRYALLVHPVALGKGLPIFSDITQVRRLELISSTAFPGGAVAQIYWPA
jgi:dihydrofolate reductase